jgi:hypothetical protein
MENITPEVAAKIFIERIIIDVYKSTYSYAEKQLAESSSNQVDNTSETKWYLCLGKDDQERVKEIIQDRIKAAIFGVLAILDNVRGGPPLRGQKSDFALYIQTYNDSKAKLENRWRESVRFNSLKDTELHDLFSNILYELEQE